MQNQTIDHQDYSQTINIKVFLLGMVVAFLISIGLSSSNSNTLISDHAVVDCDNSASLIEAQDRSRNGIANGCPIF